MRFVIVGLVIGAVIGVVLGATVVAPRMKPPVASGEPAPVAEAEGGPAPPVRLPARPFVRPSVQLKMASAFAGEMPHLGELAKRVEREVRQISGGNLDIAFHEPGELVPVDDMFSAVAAGTVDAAFASPGMWGNDVPTLQLFNAIPFGPGADEYLAWFYFGGGRELFEDIYNRRGVHALVCGILVSEASGWFRREINALADLRGLRMRIFGLGGKVLERLGAETNDLPASDIFLAMETGQIDAAEFSMPVVDLSLGFHGLAKHLYFPGWHQPATLLELMINLEKWDGLSSAEQGQIATVCGDNVRQGLSEGAAGQYAALKEMFAAGVEFHRWPPQVLDAMEDAWEDVVSEEAGADAKFRRVWRSLKTFRADYAIWRELSRR